MFLNIPRVSLLEWHPFTLTSAPGEQTDSVAIRELGDFTRDLRRVACAAAARHQQLYVRVEGPYGDLSFDPRKVPVSLYVAGGIGVTPVISVLRHVFLFRDQRGSRRTSTQSRSRMYVVWSIQEEVRLLEV